MIHYRSQGFTLITVCACLVFCSALVVTYYQYIYQQSLTYHRLERDWIVASKHNLKVMRKFDQQFTKHEQTGLFSSTRN